MWKLDIKDNRLIPLEFIDLTKSDDGVKKDQLRFIREKLSANPSFIHEFADILRRSNTAECLGLQLIHRDVILRPNEYLSEVSDVETRVSVVTSVPELPCMDVPVSWIMGPNESFCENCIPDYDTMLTDCDGSEGTSGPGEHLKCKGSKSLSCGCNCGAHCSNRSCGGYR